MESRCRQTDFRAMAELRYQIRRFMRFSENAAQQAGMEPQQHQLLLALKGLPRGMKPTINALAERLQLQHHSTVGLVDRLVERGFLVRLRAECKTAHLAVYCNSPWPHRAVHNSPLTSGGEAHGKRRIP